VQDVEHPTTQLGKFAVNTEVFSGPLELLITLIEKRKLLINDISLASVTDEYIRHVAEMEQSHLKQTSQFVVLASTLLLIKSKSLLPVLSLTSEEEDNIEDLQDRLRLYQIFRSAGKNIEDIFGATTNYERTYKMTTKPLFVLDEYTEASVLKDIIQEVIAKLPKKVTRPKVRVSKVVSLEEMIDRLRQKIERQFKFGFRDLTNNSKERGTIIVGFLAVLEMVKQGQVLVRQVSTLTEIEIERDSNSTPRYV